MELSRLGIKLFAVDPSAVRLKDIVPIFHSWIQKQCIKEHQLIDVHDYSHIHHGPGILLVAHEGNFSTDIAEGKLGIAYFRKQPDPTADENLRAAWSAVLEAAALLEAEPALEGRLRFLRDELLVISNDRLLAPNSAASFEALKPTLSRVFGGNAVFTHASVGTPDRLTIRGSGLS